MKRQTVCEKRKVEWSRNDQDRLKSVLNEGAHISCEAWRNLYGMLVLIWKFLWIQYGQFRKNKFGKYKTFEMWYLMLKNFHQGFFLLASTFTWCNPMRFLSLTHPYLLNKIEAIVVLIIIDTLMNYSMKNVSDIENLWDENIVWVALPFNAPFLFVCQI